MKRVQIVALIAIAVVALAVSGVAGAAGMLQEDGGDEANDATDAEDEAEGPDVAITGDALDQASAAALDYLGEGRVTGTEVGDEEGYYEIEVTLDGGGQVDVHLDEAFNVLSSEAD